MDSNMDSRILNTRAAKKLCTVNPPINLPAKRIIQALITNKNSPNVTMVIGKVRMIKMGFNMALRNAKTAATIIAVVKLVTSTPGKKYAKTKTAIAVSKILKSKFIVPI